MSERRKRIPELDGLRTLMIFIVSWYHIWQQSWLRPAVGGYSLDYLVRSGYVWVDGTVLLSAFLLFLPYARAMRGAGPVPDTREFYYRRARRIIPAYYFIVLAVLFGIALPWNLYRHDGPYLVKDVATHLTFTFPFFYDTYVATPLGAASWTLAIEAQAYLLFPLLARGIMKKPAATLGAAAAVCFGFRAWCLWGLQDYTMVVNQLLNFGDVYVLGILGAMLFLRLEESAGKREGPRKYAGQAAATLVFAAALFGLARLLRFQAGSRDYYEIQSRQMMYRPVFALCFSAMALSAPFALLPLRKLLGNPVTRFLGGVSMNYYLIHQTVTVHLKRLGIPASASETPNVDGEQPWQTQYTLLAFGLSLALAVLVTYAVEKPAARLMDRLRAKRKARVISSSSSA